MTIGRDRRNAPSGLPGAQIEASRSCRRPPRFATNYPLSPNFGLSGRKQPSQHHPETLENTALLPISANLQNKSVLAVTFPTFIRLD